MKWVTRERPVIDRIACPWLITRFIDKEPEFLFVPPDQVRKVADETGAIPYDVPGVEYTHVGEGCSFDAFVEKHDLAKDPAIATIAAIVRGADTDRHDLTPQSAGLLAISMGLRDLSPDDHEVLKRGFIIYDALYAWASRRKGETHNWPPVSKATAARQLTVRHRRKPMIKPVAVTSAIVLAGLIVSAKAETITFGGGQPGALPKDFASALTWSGAVGRWEVAEDSSADGGKALAQLDSVKTDYRFPLAIYATTFPQDLDIGVRFKAVSGSVDRAGGVAFRLQNPQNYYLVRANALEDNVRLYRVRNGKRQELTGARAKVPTGEWQSLAVRAGEPFRGSFNSKALFEARDETFTTAGKVALWTKADSVTRFNRVEITPLPDRSLPLLERSKP